MITKDHLNVLIARGTPGPGTYEPSTHESQARVRFGTAKRRTLSDPNLRGPGPVYHVTGDPESPPSQIKFGKASRFDRDGESLSRGLGSIGPGQYETPTVFDGANLAKSFGASHRAYDRVRFPGSERLEVGKASSGPGPARPFEAKGRACSFGQAERLPGGPTARSPGPGAYDSHTQPSPFSKNKSGHSFGRPPPRRLQSCSNSLLALH